MVESNDTWVQPTLNPLYARWSGKNKEGGAVEGKGSSNFKTHNKNQQIAYFSKSDKLEAAASGIKDLKAHRPKLTLRQKHAARLELAAREEALRKFMAEEEKKYAPVDKIDAKHMEKQKLNWENLQNLLVVR